MRGAAGLRMLLVIVVTVGSLALALWGVDPREVTHALASVHLARLPAAMAVIALVFVIRVVRFQLLLGEHRPSLRRQLVVCGVGFLAINVVPLRLGEFVRPFMLLEDGVPWGRSLGAVVLERVLDLFMLLAMMLGVSLLVDLPATVLVRGIDVLDAGQKATGIALAVLVAGLLALLFGGPGLAAGLARLPGAGPKLGGFALAMRAAVHDLARRPLTGLAVVGMAAAIWGLTILSVYLLLAAVPGLPVQADVALAVTAITVAGTVAIPTPGFFGPFEAFCKATLVLWGVDGALATAFAIVWHAHSFGFHLITGVALLFAQGLSLTALVTASRASAPDTRG